MTALDLSTLTLAEKTLAGRVVIQVLNDLRYAVAECAAVDVHALNLYEEAKIASLKIRAPEEKRQSTGRSEELKQ